MRVLVSVLPEEGRLSLVEVRLGSTSGKLLASHQMRRLEEEPWVAPYGAKVPFYSAPHASLLSDAESRKQLAKRFVDGKPDPDEVLLMGRYLFDSLLGASAWKTILEAVEEHGAQAFELALAWPVEDRKLHRACWEAMHDGRDFVAAHPSLPIAITRLVDGPSEEGDGNGSKPRVRRIQAPATVLFVLATDLDDRDIRAGAELMGLLRDAERGESAIDSHVIQRTTLGALERECRRLRPDIVHFISHGRFDDDEGGGLLLLRPDEDDDDGWTGVEKLLPALGSGGRLPAVAVLTGCETAATGEHMDSLAAQFVAGGIPCVVGMAGKIADPVSRLFSRRFAATLVEGEPLVDVLTHARRAGLQKQSHAASDDNAWALPSIHLDSRLSADYAPVDCQNASAALKRFKAYGLLDEPIFCGRAELGGLFGKLLDPDDELEVLIACSKGSEKVGKTRLLHELAGRALRGGHVVVMIDDRGSTRDRDLLPGSPFQLAARMLSSIGTTRRRFNLPVPLESQLLLELEDLSGNDPGLRRISTEESRWTRFGRFLLECEEGAENGTFDGKPIEGSLRQALSYDLVTLIREARASGDPSIGAHSRAIVVAGSIGKWGSATWLIGSSLLEANGLGDDNEHVPLFATAAFEDDREALKASREKLEDVRWGNFKDLGKFKEGEDLLAYRWVLLHPRRRPIANFPPLSAYVPKFDEPGKVEEWQRFFTNHIRGIPSMFMDPIFQCVVESLEAQRVLVKADDNEVLAQYMEKP